MAGPVPATRYRTPTPPTSHVRSSSTARSSPGVVPGCVRSRHDRRVRDRAGVRDLSTVVLRRGLEVENPLELALEFLGPYSSYDDDVSSDPASFEETDLRLANRGGARISAAQIAAILDRRADIEEALLEIDPGASLASPAGSIPWAPLTHLFDAFADIHGIGFSKMTKALHKKRPALIPILDSVVQAYLATEGPGLLEPFATRATALVRSYKRDLDRNRRALREIQRELASREYRLTEVRILDILIWSASAGS